MVDLSKRGIREHKEGEERYKLRQTSGTPGDIDLLDERISPEEVKDRYDLPTNRYELYDTEENKSVWRAWIKDTH